MTEQPRQLRGTELKRLHRGWRRLPRPRLALLLDNVVGPFNVGSIVRTAAALGVDRLFLGGETPSPRSPKVQKTALGTDRYLDSVHFEQSVEAVRAARDDGFAVVGVELAEHAVPVSEHNLARDVCLVLGHEDRGVAPAVLATCDAVVYVPQLGKVGSLNVASAAAVACFEARRQAWAHDSVDD